MRENMNFFFIWIYIFYVQLFVRVLLLLDNLMIASAYVKVENSYIYL